jgi:hypothetical protein
MNDVFRLSSYILPDNFGIKRDLPRRATEPTNAGWEFYDRSTLVYDAVFLPRQRTVRLLMPRLFNLEPLLASAQFSIDGVAVKPKRHAVFRRFETFDFTVEAETAKEITLQSPQLGAVDLALNAADYGLFENRRVIYTLLKNEPLGWIRDWLTFHRQVHGADAVLIADNGSTAYSIDDLRAAIRSVPGYDVCRLLSVPLPWGSRGSSPGLDDGKFLQTTLLNLVRDRFFQTAYGVLNVDVDELVVGSGRATVFERAQRWGYVTFPGEWRFARTLTETPRHADHLYRDPKVSGCATKYCFKPSSWLGRRCLSVHSLERISRKFFSGAREFKYLHCRAISTSWKYSRKTEFSSDMVLDDNAKQVFETVFGTQQGGIDP